MDDCGGKYSHIHGKYQDHCNRIFSSPMPVNSRGSRKKANSQILIKDCSECMIPHAPKGYDYICDKFRVHNA